MKLGERYDTKQMQIKIQRQTAQCSELRIRIFNATLLSNDTPASSTLDPLQSSKERSIKPLIMPPQVSPHLLGLQHDSPHSC
jgi:hypothetical protein